MGAALPYAVRDTELGSGGHVGDKENSGSVPTPLTVVLSLGEAGSEREEGLCL